MSTTIVGCEGRCGTRLTEEGRERGIVAPEVGDWAPFHTPQRCRGIRELREAIVERQPHASVDICPGHGVERLAIYVNEERDGRLFTATRQLRDHDLLAAQWPGMRKLVAADISLELRRALNADPR